MSSTFDIVGLVSITSFAILFMQAGITLLNAGHCRTANVKSIVAKIGFGAALTILVWWFWGFGFATGVAANNAMEFVGSQNNDTVRWFLMLVLCILTTSIVSGAVTDRMKSWVYGFLVIAIAGGTFPLLVNWTWINNVHNFNGSGWLAKRGVIDYAGAGFIHLAAGTAGLVAAHVVGARDGRFSVRDGKKIVTDLLPYDAITSTAGTWILIFGWMNYLFVCCIRYMNAGADNAILVGGRAVVLAMIAMAASAFFACFLMFVHKGRAVFSLQLVNNALLGGLVGITAGAANCDGIGAFFIGIGSGIVAFYGPNVAVLLNVDDPRDIVTVHFLQAIWGLFAIGLWAKNEYTFRATDGADSPYGAFYSGDGVLLGYQLVYICVVFLVSLFITAFALFFCWALSSWVFFEKTDHLRPNAAVADDEICTEFPYMVCSSCDKAASDASGYSNCATSDAVVAKANNAV